MTPIFVITLGDIIGITLGAIASLGVACFFVWQWWIQRSCKHDSGVTETQSCAAICKGCGKNLGFIGAWRKAQGENND